MEKIVDFIDIVLQNKNDSKKISEVKKSINSWMSDYPLFKE